MSDSPIPIFTRQSKSKDSDTKDVLSIHTPVILSTKYPYWYVNSEGYLIYPTKIGMQASVGKCECPCSEWADALCHFTVPAHSSSKTIENWMREAGIDPSTIDYSGQPITWMMATYDEDFYDLMLKYANNEITRDQLISEFSPDYAYDWQTPIAFDHSNMMCSSKAAWRLSVMTYQNSSNEDAYFIIFSVPWDWTNRKFRVNPSICKPDRFFTNFDDINIDKCLQEGNANEL